MKSKLILLFALSLIGLQATAFSEVHARMIKSVAPAVGSIKAVSTRAQRAASQPPRLTYSQNQALAAAWHAGYHVGLPLAFTAIVYVESSGCKNVHGDNGLAFGCSQVHEAAAYAATGFHIPAWVLSDPDLRALNMAVGARYLQMCIDSYHWPAGIGCYKQGLHTKLSRRALSHLSYTRRVLAAMVWLRNLPMSED